MMSRTAGITFLLPLGRPRGLPDRPALKLVSVERWGIALSLLTACFGGVLYARGSRVWRPPRRIDGGQGSRGPESAARGRR